MVGKKNGGIIEKNLWAVRQRYLYKLTPFYRCQDGFWDFCPIPLSLKGVITY